MKSQHKIEPAVGGKRPPRLWVHRGSRTRRLILAVDSQRRAPGLAGRKEGNKTPAKIPALATQWGRSHRQRLQSYHRLPASRPRRNPKIAIAISGWRLQSQSQHHGYAEEDKRIMAAVARHVLSVVEGTGTSNVVSLR